MSTSRHRIPILLAVVLLFAASCSSGSSQDDDMNMDDEHAAGAFGEPGDAANATRTIEVTANDNYTFDPPSVAISKGETVIFKVTNAGSIPHTFLVGDQAAQDEHEEEMTSGENMAGMHDEPNIVEVQPGETGEVVWHFTDSGTFIYGCHETGHYAAGMKGTIIVTG